MQGDTGWIPRSDSYLLHYSCPESYGQRSLAEYNPWGSAKSQVYLGTKYMRAHRSPGPLKLSTPCPPSQATYRCSSERLSAAAPTFAPAGPSQSHSFSHLPGVSVPPPFGGRGRPLRSVYPEQCCSPTPTLRTLTLLSTTDASAGPSCGILSPKRRRTPGLVFPAASRA